MAGGELKTFKLSNIVPNDPAKFSLAWKIKKFSEKMLSENGMCLASSSFEVTQVNRTKSRLFMLLFLARAGVLNVLIQMNRYLFIFEM